MSEAWDWLKGLGNNAYGWMSDNPLDALALGVGAAGTGFGMYEQAQARRDAEKRQRLAEQFARMGPESFAPNFSPEYLQARYFRPASQFMSASGVNNGGAFQAGLADAALRAEQERLQMGQQTWQNRLASLGVGGPVPASGSVGGLGQAMQMLMLSRALAGRNAQPVNPMASMPAVADPNRFRMTGPGEESYNALWNGSSFNTQIPSGQVMEPMNPFTAAGKYWPASDAMESRGGDYYNFYPENF